MSADRAFTVIWTEITVKLVEPIADHRIRHVASRRADQIRTSPQATGKPLMDELAGFRRVPPISKRYRTVYRLERRK
jgi:mRNA interferase RelE/StbE